MAAASARPSSSRDAISAARRVVVKVGSSSLTRRAGSAAATRSRPTGRAVNGATVARGPRAGPDVGSGPRDGSSVLAGVSAGIDVARVNELVDALGAAGHRGAQLVLVSSGAIATGIAPLGLRRRPRDLASAQAAASVGQGILMAHYHDAFAPPRSHGRAGAAHRRRPDPPRALPQRPAHPRATARARCRADRQRERHRGHRGDPLRGQRPPRRAGGPPGPRRRPDPAVRRRRPVRRAARQGRQPPHRRGGLGCRP